MKYLRSLMQQSVTACKNQAKLIQQFTLSLLYLLIIHINTSVKIYRAKS